MQKLFTCLLLFCSAACADPVPESTEREREFRELPVCAYVKPNVPCREGDKRYPRGKPEDAMPDDIPPDWLDRPPAPEDELWRGTNPVITDI
jgi:hypothetical protein